MFKNRFFSKTAKRPERKEVKAKNAKKKTTPMTIKTINIIKNPRQRRQFDPLSRADQKRVFLTKRS